MIGKRIFIHKNQFGIVIKNPCQHKYFENLGKTIVEIA
jgi:hypothetical protein